MQEISLEIYPGECVGIVGGTGSGKTTLAMHFNGLLKPERGKVFIEGKELNYTSGELAQLRRRVGLVFQYPEHQLFGKTVWDDISFILTRRQEISPAEIKEKVKAACTLVGLESEDFWQRSPWELSRGEMRRVALAGILVQEPNILILDEPTVGLDGAGKREILQEISSLHQAGQTVIIIAHEMEELLDIVERLIVLDQGRILIDGSPAEVLTHLWQSPKFTFLVPPLYQLSLELKEKGWVIPVWRTKETIDYWHATFQKGEKDSKKRALEN